MRPSHRVIGLKQMAIILEKRASRVGLKRNTNKPKVLSVTGHCTSSIFINEQNDRSAFSFLSKLWKHRYFKTSIELRLLRSLYVVIWEQQIKSPYRYYSKVPSFDYTYLPYRSIWELKYKSRNGWVPRIHCRLFYAHFPRVGWPRITPRRTVEEECRLFGKT